ncbi:Fc receptor-like protein 5 [Sardina pilchardus]|uniref:Fc receptor-like protein 5 n=1 Tax=Sardina pilchardus TaxID=27697 RepID=UPI002E13BF1B
MADNGPQFQSLEFTTFLASKERPKAAVSVTPDSRDIFSGDSVTLRCEIPEGGNTDWDYSWYFNRSPESPVATGQQYIISSATDLHSGDYTCRGTQRGTTQSSDTSDVLTLTVAERPKAVVSLSPSWTPVFSGESVTLTCSIQGESPSDWRYSWYRGDQQVHPHTGWSDSDEYRLQSVQEDHSGVYSCRGSRRRDSKVSHMSDDLTLTVSKRPKAAVALTPNSRDIFRGEYVILRCEIPSGRNTDWDYSWYFNRSPKSPVATGQQYSIRSAADLHSGDYTCRGTQRGTTQSSDTSDVLTLTMAERPKAVVSLSPSWIPVFSGESITLTCSIQGESPSDWRYRWYRGDQQVHPQRGWSDSDEYRLQSVQEDHSGVYSCRGSRIKDAKVSHQSDGVKLTVSKRPKAAVTLTPNSRDIFRGEYVTLRCEIPSRRNTYWDYSWYFNRSPKSPVATGQQYSIRSAADLHSGDYTCRGTQRGTTQSSDTSDVLTLTVADSKPKLTLSPAYQLLTGDSVTLRCELGVSSGLVFYWYRDTQTSDHVAKTDVNSYSISSVKVSDGGQYWCRAGRGDPVYYTQYSDAAEIKVADRLKATITLKSKWTEFFSEEEVSLRCDIESGESSDWEYSWFRDGERVYSNRRNMNLVKEYEIQPSQSGNYTCKGQKKHQKKKTSEESDNVAITIYSEKAQALLSSLSQTWLTEGDAVTLSCEVRGSTTGWRFHWYKTAPFRSDLIHVTYASQTSGFPQTHGNKGYSLEPVSNSIRGAGGSYTLSPAALRHTGVYVCRAERGEPAYHTEFSQPQPLWVTGVSLASVSTHSNWSQIFTSESLSLSCGVQGNSTGWTLRWFTGRGGGSECSTDWRSETGSSCSISSASPSDSGVYWCQSESGEQSNPVNITVYHGDVILESPVHPVTEGDLLSLRCRYRRQLSNISADFYKDGTLLQTSTTGEMTIPAVSKSHEGLYECRHPDKGESPESWITVKVTIIDSGSFLLVAVGVVVGMFFSFVVFWLHRSKYLTGLCLTTTTEGQQQQDLRTNQSSDQDQRTNQSSDQDQSQCAGGEGSHSEYMPLQKRTTDVYDTITPLYMPLQKGATDVYETIKTSNNSQEDEEEGYEDMIPSDTRAEEHV